MFFLKEPKHLTPKRNVSCSFHLSVLIVPEIVRPVNATTRGTMKMYNSFKEAQIAMDVYPFLIMKIPSYFLVP